MQELSLKQRYTTPHHLKVGDLVVLLTKVTSLGDKGTICTVLSLRGGYTECRYNLESNITDDYYAPFEYKYKKFKATTLIGGELL